VSSTKLLLTTAAQSASPGATNYTADAPITAPDAPRTNGRGIAFAKGKALKGRRGAPLRAVIVLNGGTARFVSHKVA
jgi:hypothetical protein